MLSKESIGRLVTAGLIAAGEPGHTVHHPKSLRPAGPTASDLNKYLRVSTLLEQLKGGISWKPSSAETKPHF